MEDETYKPHVEELKKALETADVEMDETSLENELRTYVEQYRVPLDVAKVSIVKKYGGDERLLGGSEWTKISSLAPGLMSVNLVARVVTANTREIEGIDGPKTIVYGILGDDTGTVPFTLWEGSFPYEKGDVLKIRNAYTKDWQGQVQVNMGRRTSITRADEDLIPPVFGRQPVEAKIGELREGMRNVTATFRVIEVEEREVEVQGATKTVISGICGDETGMARFSAWGDFDIVRDGVYRVTGAYVNSWRGVPRLTFDDRGTIERLDDDALPPAEEIKNLRPVSLENLIKNGGAIGVLVRGFLIDIKPGSGLIKRCPECNRVIQKGMCMVHGKVDGKPDLRIKGVIDDGTGAVTVVLNREITEKLAGKTLQEYMAEAQEAMTPEVVRDDLLNKLLARPIEVRGNATKDEYGVMIIGEDARLYSLDVEKEARELMQEIEGGL